MQTDTCNGEFADEYLSGDLVENNGVQTDTCNKLSPRAAAQLRDALDQFLINAEFDEQED